jgi:hypothetical protein
MLCGTILIGAETIEKQMKGAPHVIRSTWIQDGVPVQH